MSADPITKLAILSMQRNDLQEELTKIRNLISSYSKTKVTLGGLKYDAAKKLRDEFKIIQKEILVTNALVEAKNQIERDKSKRLFDSAFEIIEVIYTEMLDNASNAAAASLQASTSNVSSAQSGVRLPDIKVPVFSNDIKDFPNFEKLFSAVYVKNKSLTDTEKFYYLISLLRGESLALVQQFPLSDQGFKKDYDALKKRYDSSRALATIYVNELFNFEPLKKATSQNLARFLEIHLDQVTALKSLDDVTDLGDFLLMQLCARNLDPLTRRLFEQQVTTAIPSYQELIDFVTKQCQTQTLLENEKSDSMKAYKKPSNPVQLLTNNSSASATRSQSHASQKPNSSKKSSQYRPKAISCGFCNASDHKIYQCSDYIKLGYPERVSWIQTHSRCYGCLGLYHDISKCNSLKSCSVCDSRLHHSSLHDPNTDTKPKETQTLLSCNRNIERPRPQVLLETLVGHVVDSAGYTHPVRCVLDSGSMTSLVTLDSVRRLGLKMCKSDSLSISGVGGLQSEI